MKKLNLNKKQFFAIIIILIIGLVLSSLILFFDPPKFVEEKHSNRTKIKHEDEKDNVDTGHHAETINNTDNHIEKHNDVDKENADKNSRIEISDEQIKAAGIILQIAKPARISSRLQLPGEIRFNQDYTAHVIPRLTGVVENVYANLGQQVKKGQVLAVIASTQLAEQRSELLSAQKRLALAQLTYTREKKLWQDKISAEQDFLQAQQVLQETEIAVQNAQQKLIALDATEIPHVLSRYKLRAPFNGMVVEKHITLGEAVKEDTNIFTISDLSTVWAEVIVSAKDLNAVYVGEKAIVRAIALNSQTTGTISYVSSLLDEQTRTAKAHITLTNPNLTWRPGLFVNVELMSNEVEIPVTVSVDAIQNVNDKPTVFIKTTGGFIMQPIVTGRTDGKLIEIIKGLKSGVSYAASGSFVIKAEQGKSNASHQH